ncbi:MAG TPA: hypothetical protein VHZ33_19365 [Trebonia sp.]|jgi:hypothetical protein|nr:hypothetical protein [Trebonia sp.]
MLVVARLIGCYLANPDSFRLTIAQARAAVAEVEEATSGWRHEAEQLSLPRQQIERMADAFETSQRAIARRT